MSKEINDNTPLSGKYNTIGTLKSASIRSAIQTVSRMSNCAEREYLSKWLFETHYLKKIRGGSLTTRIKPIQNKICYCHIINHCFDGINVLNFNKNIPILNDECTSIIDSLHAIDPSSTGTFMDYLIRRIIQEIKQETFLDTRANEYTCLDGFNFLSKEPLWEFHVDDNIGGWNVSVSPDMGSEKIESIRDGDRFIELERKNEWLKIKYKRCIGWVRYLVPDVPLTLGVEGDIKDYIPNKCFSQIKNHDDMHYCDGGCKTKFEQTRWSVGSECKECKFDCCQHFCYMKVRDTTRYKTDDILKELYIVSCCHSEWFGGVISQNNYNQIVDILEKIDICKFIKPLFTLCRSLLMNSKKVLLNPALGGGKNLIPADCDLVIDDLLIDIKCTKKKKDIPEILQLLGYTSLLKKNKKYKVNINNICIINLLRGECDVYNIENLLNKHLFSYLSLLTNKYDAEKEIKKRKKNIDTMSFPSFIDK
tara:strand:+ start:2975 stop:4408 length:1434 start_codon:yes stop_codon:yes gene_type:complete